jgi:hypothetical protein
MRGGKRPGAGRKPAKIDLEELEKLSALHATDEELAAFFGVSTRTIENRRKQPRYAAVMERGRAKGRLSIRRGQIKLLERQVTRRWACGWGSRCSDSGTFGR